MKTVRLLCCIILLATSPAYAGMHGGQGGQAGHGMMGFSHLDANHDGQLSRDEFQTMMQGSAHPDDKEAAFKMIDKDNDGSISNGEWDAFTDSHAKAMGRHNQGTPQSDQLDCNKTQ